MNAQQEKVDKIVQNTKAAHGKLKDLRTALEEAGYYIGFFKSNLRNRRIMHVMLDGELIGTWKV